MSTQVYLPSTTADIARKMNYDGIGLEKERHAANFEVLCRWIAPEDVDVDTLALDLIEEVIDFFMATNFKAYVNNG